MDNLEQIKLGTVKETVSQLFYLFQIRNLTIITPTIIGYGKAKHFPTNEKRSDFDNLTVNRVELRESRTKNLWKKYDAFVFTNEKIKEE